MLIASAPVRRYAISFFVVVRHALLATPRCVSISQTTVRGAESATDHIGGAQLFVERMLLHCGLEK
jgi:hypothetical protein